MDDTPYINDGADASLRKTVSLLNKIESNTSGGGGGGGGGSLTDAQLRASPVPVDIGGSGSITITSGTVTVSNEVEVKNDSNNPLPVSDNGGSLTVDGSVSVSNFPATQPVSGSVSVSNFPATQPVSGSVSVSNFPATQPVSGTVTANAGTNLNTSALALETTATAIKTAVETLDNAIAGNEMQVDIVSGTVGISGTVPVSGTFFQATQPVSDAGGSLTVDGSVSVSNLPASYPVTDNGGSLTVDGSVSVSNFPATQPVSGSVSVSNFPATQPVSGTVTANAGTGSFTVAQATAASLNATVVGSGSFTATQATHANLKAQAQILDSSGNQLTYAATGTAGSPASDVVTVQGIASGTAVAIRPRHASVAANVVASSTANTSSNIVLAQNTTRQYLLIQNLSDTDMNINFGAAASTSSMLIPKNGGGIVFETGFVPTDAVQLRCSAAPKAYYILHA